jgi:excisionase family DNA binding protein
MDPKDALTPTQAAKLLKVNRSTVVRWCQQGKIKAWKIGNQWVIDRDEVEKRKNVSD